MFYRQLSILSTPKFEYNYNLGLIKIKNNSSNHFRICYLGHFSLKESISIEEYIMILVYLQIKGKSLTSYEMTQLCVQYFFNKNQQDYNSDLQKWFQQHQQDELATQCQEQNTTLFKHTQFNIKEIINILFKPIDISLKEFCYVEKTLLPLIKQKLQEAKKKS